MDIPLACPADDAEPTLDCSVPPEYDDEANETMGWDE